MALSATSIIARVAPEHRAKFATPVSVEIASTLRTMLNSRFLRPAVDPVTADQLIAAGYAHQTLGGLSLSDAGRVAADMENAR